MKFYSFEKLNKNVVSETDTDGTYFLIDLFERSVINNNDIKNAVYYVEQDYSCRMDNICSKLYEGSTGYVEELTVLNHILNPFSVEKGDYILYTKNPNDFSGMYVNEVNKNDSNKFKILNINKNKTSSNVELPPSVNPGLKQIDIDYQKRKITVINKFK